MWPLSATTTPEKRRWSTQLLFNAGAITRLGRIDDGTTVTDFDQDEIDRKHSISTAIAFAEWQNTKINFIDTPGFGIFVMEARARCASPTPPPSSSAA